MAVEIREIIVRAVLEKDQHKGQTSDADDDDEGGPSQGVSSADMDTVIRTAVEQVMRILERKKMR